MLKETVDTLQGKLIKFLRGGKTGGREEALSERFDTSDHAYYEDADGSVKLRDSRSNLREALARLNQSEDAHQQEASEERVALLRSSSNPNPNPNWRHLNRGWHCYDPAQRVKDHSRMYSIRSFTIGERETASHKILTLTLTLTLTLRSITIGERDTASLKISKLHWIAFYDNTRFREESGEILLRKEGLGSIPPVSTQGRALRITRQSVVSPR